MATAMPEGEEIRKAIKWISMNREDKPDTPLFKLVDEAVFKFDLSPLDADFLLNFFRKKKEE
jgi:hypothetical protein